MIEAWGPAGLEAHTRRMQESYSERAAVLQAAAGTEGQGANPVYRQGVVLKGLAHTCQVQESAFLAMCLRRAVETSVLDYISESRVLLLGRMSWYEDLV